MHTKLLIGILAVIFVSIVSSSALLQENEPPVVQITSPQGNTQFTWDAYIPFSISVLDHEDGNSEYDEIPSQEVIMTVQYFSDSLETDSFSSRDQAASLNILSWMGTSNCFTCHNAKDKLIGPSFSQIAERYADQGNAIAYLTEKVTEGTTGTWGNQIMPAQPNLSLEGLNQAIQWILKNGSRQDLNYFTGIEGAFKTPAKIKGFEDRTICVITAQYTDHGLENVPGSAKKGVDFIVLRKRQEN